MRIAIIILLVTASYVNAETNATAGVFTNRAIATAAANTVGVLTARWINNSYYPLHDKESGIGQGTCVKYVGPTNTAPSRISGIVVSRIITDLTKANGEKWCLVEFGEGPPWSGYVLTNLVTMPVSQALKDFPAEGMKTVMKMMNR